MICMARFPPAITLVTRFAQQIKEEPSTFKMVFIDLAPTYCLLLVQFSSYQVQKPHPISSIMRPILGTSTRVFRPAFEVASQAYNIFASSWSSHSCWDIIFNPLSTRASQHLLYHQNNRQVPKAVRSDTILYILPLHESGLLARRSASYGLTTRTLHHGHQTPVHLDTRRRRSRCRSRCCFHFCGRMPCMFYFHIKSLRNTIDPLFFLQIRQIGHCVSRREISGSFDRTVLLLLTNHHYHICGHAHSLLAFLRSLAY